jgi:hypothetical protein
MCNSEFGAGKSGKPAQGKNIGKDVGPLHCNDFRGAPRPLEPQNDRHSSDVWDNPLNC